MSKHELLAGGTRLVFSVLCCVSSVQVTMNIQMHVSLLETALLASTAAPSRWGPIAIEIQEREAWYHAVQCRLLHSTM